MGEEEEEEEEGEGKKKNTQKNRRSLLSPIARSGSTPPESVVLTVVPGECR